MNKYITIKDLTETINIADVEKTARDSWDKQQRRRRKLETWVVRLLPVGLIVMVIAFYLLSAPHTAYLLDMITPGWGFIAPIGFELGILITSALRERGVKNLLTLGLIVVLIGMAIVINVAGGFMAVLEVGGEEVRTQTFAALLSGFGGLTAAYQAALLLVLPIGACIPFIAALAGEILIKLATGKIRMEHENDEQRWVRDSPTVMYAALLQSALQKGAGVSTAQKFAQSVATGLTAYGMPTAAPARPTVMPTAMPQVTAGLSETVGTVAGQSAASFSPFSIPKTGTAESVQVQKDQLDTLDSPAPRLSKADVLAWLRRNDVAHLNDREACKAYMRDKFGYESDAGYKTFNRARKEL